MSRDGEMNKDQVSLEELGALFLNLSETGLPSNSNHTTYWEVLDRIGEVILRKTPLDEFYREVGYSYAERKEPYVMTDEPDYIYRVKVAVEEETLLPFLDRYLQHENWKFRVCGVLLAAHSLNMEKLHSRNEIRDRFWRMLGDSDPRVLEALATGAQHIGKWLLVYTLGLGEWHGCEFDTLPIAEEERRAWDVEFLVQTCMEFPPEIRTEFFWGLVSHLAERIRAGEDVQITPILVRLIKGVLLPVGSAVWTKTEAYYGVFPLLELLMVLWCPNPPLYVDRELVHIVVDFFKSDRMLPEYWEMLHYDTKTPFSRAIVHQQDIDGLVRYLRFFRCISLEYTDELIELLFSLAYETGWNAGMSVVLQHLIKLTTWYFIGADSDYLISIEYNIDTVVSLLTQYLNAGNTCDPTHLKELSELYKTATRYLAHEYEYPHPKLEEAISKLKPLLICLGVMVD